MDDANARGREQLAAARAAVRAQQPERKVAVPVSIEFPTWATHLPTQASPQVPTPRGSE
jgi:hypothetical protein